MRCGICGAFGMGQPFYQVRPLIERGQAPDAAYWGDGYPKDRSKKEG